MSHRWMVFAVLVSLLSFEIFIQAQEINIDGQWSPWSNIQTPCLDAEDRKTPIFCGGGIRKRLRSCSNPTKQGNGKDCEGPKEEYFPCNTHSCRLPDEYLWSPWSRCSVTCGRGIRKRYTMCGTIRKKSNDETLNDEKSAYELEYEEACISNQFEEATEECNTWNKEVCPSPCSRQKCVQFSKCIDLSNDTDPVFKCECQLGTKMKDDQSTCIEPPPVTPTPKPKPSLPPAQKVVANVMTRGASTIIIIFLSITLGLFIIFRIFNTSRIIHMNMEIALLAAHLCMLPTIDGENNAEICTIISLLTNFFFLACFMFMFLEAIHMYSVVAWVVRKGGLFTSLQNIMVGWGCSFIIVLLNMCFEYESFGGEYHCFLKLDSPLMYGIYVPIIILVILTLAIVEAAGISSDYTKLESFDKNQRLTAQIIQRTLIFILPLVFISYIIGTLAEFHQNMYFYSIFTLLNGLLGGMVFFFHCTADQRIREILANMKEKLCPKRRVTTGA